MLWVLCFVVGGSKCLAKQGPWPFTVLTPGLAPWRVGSLRLRRSRIGTAVASPEVDGKSTTIRAEGIVRPVARSQHGHAIPRRVGLWHLCHMPRQALAMGLGRGKATEATMT